MIRPNARYCHSCGVPVWPLRICESCNSPTPARGAYCDQCGAVLETPGHISDVIPVSGIEQLENTGETQLEHFSPEFDPEFEFDGDDNAATEHFINPSAESSSGTPESVEDTNAEKRVVTILFADISGFTQMSERLEPEDVMKL